MSGRDLFQFYVEGECEINFLRTFMHTKNTDFIIRPGRIEKLNPVSERISSVKAMTIKKGTKVVFVFDTDVNNLIILEENIKTLKKAAGLSDKDIFLVMSVKCFEDELVLSCKGISGIRGLVKLFDSEGITSFKSDFSKCKNLEEKLKQGGFDIKLIWTKKPNKPFDKYENNRKSIKIKAKNRYK